MELGILPAPAVPTTSSPSLTPLAREDEDEPKQYQHGRVNGAAAGMVSNVVAPTAQPPNRRPTTKPKFGERPDCFKSTVQEALFALQSTVALGLTSLLTGATVILTASIGRELGMTQGEVSWISASAA